MVEASVDIGKVFLDGLIGNAVYALEIIITIIILAIIVITLFSLLKVTISSLRKREGTSPSTYTRNSITTAARIVNISGYLGCRRYFEDYFGSFTTELAILVIIVVVRVLLTFSLSKEIERRDTFQVISTLL